jgi:hypothetical protein
MIRAVIVATPKTFADTPCITPWHALPMGYGDSAVTLLESVMQLSLSARDMLIARMQAFAYENVIQGAMWEAEVFALKALTSFDAHMESANPDSEGYWAGRYFDRFVEDCRFDGESN